MNFHSTSGFPVQLLFIVAFVVIAAVSGIYANIQRRKRMEGLSELAFRLNLDFDPSENYSFADEYGFLKKLAQGDNRFAYNVCNAKMIEFLLANRDMSVEIENQVIALVFNSCLSPDQIELNLNRLTQIRSLMPDYLFTQTT